MKSKTTKKLIDIAYLKRGYNIITRKLYDENGDYFLVNLGNIDDFGDVVYDGLKRITIPENKLDNFTEKYLLEKDDILLTLRGRAGKTAFIKENVDKLTVSYNFLIIKVKNTEEILVKYLFYYLRKEKNVNRIRDLSTKKIIDVVSTKDIENFEITYPDIETQKKYVDEIEKTKKEYFEAKEKYERLIKEI
jgi:type I restriction enzyme M protein